MSNRYLLFFLIGILICVTRSYAEPTTKDEATEPSDDERKSRILDGIPSKENDFRYHVAIMRIVNEAPVLLCGGAIIHRRYVLTAAHCVNKFKSIELVVRSGGVLGPHPNSPQEEPRSFHKVIKTYIPRQYYDSPCRRHQHDIAILKLRHIFDLGFDERYKKVILPEYDHDFEGLTAFVTGYGPDYIKNQRAEQPEGIKDYSLQYVEQLRSLPMTVISNEECQYRAKVVLTEGTICTVSNVPNAQTCFEDDGGPLVRDGIIVGISNDRNCDSNVPELFTRVSYYLEFIKNVLEHRSTFDIIVI